MKKFLTFNSVFFIGIGGVSMSALARFCIRQNIAVLGSDKTENQQVKALKFLGAKIKIGHKKDNLEDVDLVVYSSAISSDNPELIMAKEKNIPTLKRSELLNVIEKGFVNRVAISGCHGKTTVTAMCTHVFSKANKNPTSFIGGIDKVYSNFKYGSQDFLIYEACEYKKNMLDLNPTLSVVLNVDNDHMDSYASMHNLIESFSTFTSKRLSLINADDVNSQSLWQTTSTTFGIKNQANYTARYIRRGEKGYSFTFYKGQIKQGRINLQIAGLHNVYNALATASIADMYKLEFKHIKKGLENFTGVNRRMELVGNGNTKLYCDYAHHPKEIQSSLLAFSEISQQSIVVFQPHTYSRTKLLMCDFLSVLSGVKNLVIYKTYPAREKYDKRGSAKTLYDNLKSQSNGKVYYSSSLATLTQTINFLIKENPKANVLFLGAGDIYELAKKLK